MTTPAFVQGHIDFVTTGTTCTSTYASAQTAGNMNVLGVFAGPSVSVSSVADTSGNKYVLATSIIHGVEVVAIYYAPSIKAAGAGANTVTVTFSGSVAGGAGEIASHEYSGVSLLDKTATGSGSGTALSTSSVTCAWSNELIFAYGESDQASSAGGSFTQRTNDTGGGISEDQITTTGGSFSGAATQSPTGNWTMVLATFTATAPFEMGCPDMVE